MTADSLLVCHDNAFVRMRPGYVAPGHSSHYFRRIDFMIERLNDLPAFVAVKNFDAHCQSKQKRLVGDDVLTVPTRSRTSSRIIMLRVRLSSGVLARKRAPLSSLPTIIPKRLPLRSVT